MGRSTRLRSRVNEYGGGAFWCGPGHVDWVDDGTQRLLRAGVAHGPAAAVPAPRPLTAAPPARLAWRYASGCSLRGGDWLVVERESHCDDHGAALPEPRNELVAVHGEDQRQWVLVASGQDGGGDFVAAPAVSPDGASVAWLTLGPPRHAVGRGRAVGRPPGAGRPRCGRARPASCRRGLGRRCRARTRPARLGLPSRVVARGTALVVRRRRRLVAPARRAVGSGCPMTVSATTRPPRSRAAARWARRSASHVGSPAAVATRSAVTAGSSWRSRPAASTRSGCSTRRPVRAPNCPVPRSPRWSTSRPMATPSPSSEGSPPGPRRCGASTWARIPTPRTRRSTCGRRSRRSSRSGSRCPGPSPSRRVARWWRARRRRGSPPTTKRSRTRWSTCR